MPEPTMVGRDAEIALLLDALGEATSGRGRVVLVRGEAGIGKTRVLAELTRLASESGTVVLSGRAVQRSGAYRAVTESLLGFLRAGAADTATDALGPYRAVLGRLLPDWLGAATDSPQHLADPGVVLGEAVARFLAEIGREHGCLFVLEDLQWADPDTLALVEHLASAVRTAPVLVVVSARDDEPDAEKATRLSGTPGVLTVPLDRLSDEEVAALVNALPDATADEATLDLARRAEGLPYLVEELIAGGTAASDLPPTLVALVGARLRTLSAPQRRVLAAAAVLGPEPDWTLLAQVSELSEDEVVEGLRGATDVGVLVSDWTALHWRHQLTRDVVLGMLLPPERSQLAAHAARALLDRGRPEDQTSAAELLLESGATAEAAQLMLTQARRNLERGALRTAEDLLDAVERLDVSAPAQPAERVRLLSLTGRASEALAFGSPFLDRLTGDDHAELALRLAAAAVDARHWDEATSYAERAGRPDDPRSWVVRADAAHGAGRVEEAEEHAARAVALAEAGARPDALCEALVITGKLVRRRDADAAATRFRRAAQVAAEHGLAGWRVEALSGLGTLELMDHEHSESLPLAHALAEEFGLLGQATAVDILMSDHAVLAGGPTAAAEIAHRLQERGERLQLPYAAAVASYLAALEPAARGQTQQLERELAEWRFPPEAGVEAGFMSAATRAVAAIANHDLERASRTLDEAIPPLLQHASAAPLHLLRAVGPAPHRHRRPRPRGAAVPGGAARGAAPCQPRCVAVRRSGCGRPRRPTPRCDGTAGRGRGARDRAAVAAPRPAPAHARVRGERRVGRSGASPARRPRRGRGHGRRGAGPHVSRPAAPRRREHPPRARYDVGAGRPRRPRRHQPRDGRAPAGLGRGVQRPGRRTALPLTAHGRDTRGEPAAQDRVRGPRRPPWLGALTP